MSHEGLDPTDSGKEWKAPSMEEQTARFRYGDVLNSSGENSFEFASSRRTPTAEEETTEFASSRPTPIAEVESTEFASSRTTVNK